MHACTQNLQFNVWLLHRKSVGLGMAPIDDSVIILILAAIPSVG